MKRNLSFFIVAVTLFSWTFAANTVTIGSGSADPGGTLSIDLELINDDEVSGFQLDITDAGGFLSSLSVSTAHAEMTISGNDLGDGVFRMIMFSITGDIIAPGTSTLCTVTWDVAADAVAGTYDLTGPELLLSDPAGNALDGTLIDGSYEVIGVVEAYDLTIGSGSADAGAQLTISLGLENTGDVGGLQIDITDAGGYLSNPAVVGVGGAASMNLGVSSPSAGVTRILLYSISGDVIAPGDGAIIELTWDVSADAAGGDYALAGSGFVISDPIGNPLSGTFTDGSYTLSEPPVNCLQANPASLDFGDVSIGEFAVLTFDIENCGNQDEMVFDIQSDNADFEADQTFISIPNGTSATVNVTFTPSAEGAVNGSLAIIYSAGALLVSLDGNGFVPEGNLVSDVTDLAFGESIVGLESTLSVPLSAEGGDVDITNITAGDGFSYAGETAFPILSGESATIDITFLPTATGDFSSTLNIAYGSEGGTLEIPLSGTGGTYFEFGESNDYYAITVSNVSGFSDYSEFGVFTQNGLCVGAGIKYPGAETVDNIQAWKLDPSPVENPGWEDGDYMFFRVWDSETELNGVIDELLVDGSQGSGQFGEGFSCSVELSTTSNAILWFDPFSPLEFGTVGAGATATADVYNPGIGTAIFTVSGGSIFSLPFGEVNLQEANNVPFAFTFNPTAPGSYTEDFTFSGNFDSDYIYSVSATRTNTAPTAIVGADQTVDESGENQVEVTLHGYYDDPDGPDGDVCTFLWTAPDGITLSDETEEHPTFIAPSVEIETVYEFTLVVNDGELDSEPAIATVTVTNIENDSPVIDVQFDANVMENTEVILDGSGTYDPDGDDLTYLWTGELADLLDDTTSATPSFTAPNVTENTDYTFTFAVSDWEFEVSETFTVTVENNVAPTADAGEDASVDEGLSYQLNGSGSDANLNGTQPTTYLWTGELADLLDDTTSATPSFTTPDVTEDTPYTFTLTVSDGELSATDDVVITVIFVNQPPIANAGQNKTVSFDELVQLDGSGSSDPDGQELGYLWNAPEGITLSDPNIVNPTFTASEGGDLIFTLTVSDGITNDSDDVTITVTDVWTLASEPSSIDFGSVIVGLDGTQSITLSAVNSDVEITSISVDGGSGFSYLGGTAFTIISGETQEIEVGFAPTVIGDQNANLVIDYGFRELLEIPLSGSGGTYFEFGETGLTYAINVTNYDLIDSYSEVGVFTQDGLCVGAGIKYPDDPQLQIVAQGSNPPISPVGWEDGDYMFFRVWDSVGGEVNGVIDAIELDDGSDGSGLFGETQYCMVTLSTTSNAILGFIPHVLDFGTVDAGATAIVDAYNPGIGDANFTISNGGVFSIDPTSGYLSEGGGTAQFTVTFNPTAPGSYTEDFTFSGNNIDDYLYPVSATRTNTAPTAIAGDNQTVFEGESVTFGGAYNDPDGDVCTYLWEGALADLLNDPEVSHPTFTAPDVDEDTNYGFTLTVNDGVATDQATVVVIVQPLPVQDFSLISGWNWIGLNVTPTDPLLSSVFASLGDNALEIMGQDENGSPVSSVYYAESGWFPDFNLIDGKGYLLKVVQGADFAIEGMIVEASTPIDLIYGWNWFSYLPSEAKSISEALAGIESIVLEIMGQDGDGAPTSSVYYEGTGWFPEIDLLPGHAYKLKVSTYGTLVIE